MALALVTSAADAQTRPQDYLLPPLEDDYPYRGTLTIVRDEKDFPWFADCPGVPTRRPAGCTMKWHRADGSLEPRCHVYIAPDEVLNAYGFPYPSVLRHEVGHCNGWGRDHKSGRSFGSPPGTAPGVEPHRLPLPDSWAKRDQETQQRYNEWLRERELRNK
jgi:hypothetical protein